MDEGNGDPGDWRRERKPGGEREPLANRRGVAERRKPRPAVIGGMIAVVVGGAGFGVYALYGAGAAADDRTQNTSVSAADQKPKVKTGPLSANEAKTTATNFL